MSSQTKTIKAWIWISILLASLFMIMVGTFDIFQFENPKTQGRIAASGFLLQASYFCREYYIKVISKKKRIQSNSFTNKKTTSSGQT